MRKEILLIIVKHCIYNFETFVVKLSETRSKSEKCDLSFERDYQSILKMERGRKRLRRIYTTNPPPPDASPRSPRLI